MSDEKSSLLPAEIESLNLDDLDVDELEHRIELATVGTDCYINCNCDGSNCTTDTCTTDCGTNCGTDCGADVCQTDCSSLGGCSTDGPPLPREEL